MDETQSEVSHLAQSLCHKCSDELRECPIAYSGATCQEIIEAAKAILEMRRKNLAERIYSSRTIRKRW